MLGRSSAHGRPILVAEEQFMLGLTQHFRRLLLVLASVPSVLPAATEVDIIVDTVLCQADASQSYAQYLPPAYDGHTALPIVYIVDPGARGRLGIETFVEAARAHQYILVCSNNAKNGSWDLLFEAANAVFADTEQRLAFDRQRVYTAGFSGGSRAALAIAALTEDKIRGVIGCGAGYPPDPSYHPQPGQSFYYLGLVGIKDMNFQEHAVVADSLQALGIANARLIFDAGHQWPPPSIIELALLRLQRVHGQALQPSSEMRYAQLKLRHLRDAGAWGFPDYALQHIDEALPWHQSIEGELLHLKDSLQTSKDYRKITRQNDKIFGYEQQAIAKYLTAFRELSLLREKSSCDMAWWRTEIDRLVSLRDKHKSRQWQYLGARLLNLIAARSAESTFRFEGQGELNLALMLTGVWAYAQPDIPHPYWYQAKIYAQKSNWQAAIDLLEKAYDHGMRREASLRHKVFAPLMDKPGYQALLQRVSSE